MSRRRVILLGIDGLSYSSFSVCKPKFLLNLFNIAYRGVVYNRKPQDHQKSWLYVLEMSETVPNKKELRLLRETNSIGINIPISNPTYGEFSFRADNLRIEEEVNKVLEVILSRIEEAPIVASIISIDRILHLGNEEEKCKLYAIVDDMVRKVVNSVDDFIVFSPFGSPLSSKQDDHEDYGVYLATIPRPSERGTIKLSEIGLLFKKLVSGS